MRTLSVVLTGVLSSVVVALDALPFALNVSVAVPDNRAALAVRQTGAVVPVAVAFAELLLIAA